MTFLLAEMIDKIGSGFEPALCSFASVIILAAVTAPWRWWLPAVLAIPIALWGSIEILWEMQEPWGKDVIAAVGSDFYVRELVSWNLPFSLTLPAGRLIHWFAPATRRERQGECPECGYDLRGQLAEGCPECGWGREENVETSKRCSP